MSETFSVLLGTDPTQPYAAPLAAAIDERSR